MAHKTDVAESTEKLSSAFAGRLAVGANDGCKALGIRKTKWFELRKADPTFPRPFFVMCRLQTVFAASRCSIGRVLTASSLQTPCSRSGGC